MATHVGVLMIDFGLETIFTRFIGDKYAKKE
jgi:hypothetical protein